MSYCCVCVTDRGASYYYSDAGDWKHVTLSSPIVPFICYTPGAYSYKNWFIFLSFNYSTQGVGVSRKSSPTRAVISAIWVRWPTTLPAKFTLSAMRWFSSKDSSTTALVLVIHLNLLSLIQIQLVELFFCNSDAYFWIGNSSRPNPSGIIIPLPADYQGKWVLLFLLLPIAEKAHFAISTAIFIYSVTLSPSPLLPSLSWRWWR